MRHRVTALAVITGLAAAAVLVAAPGSAGPDKIAFPGDKKGKLYTIADRYDVKQYRELYATDGALEAAKAGKPLPTGTVLTLIQFKAKVDPQGAPLKDANGRFFKGDIIAVAVMEKRAGWGAEYPADVRNGEWEYAVFSPDGKLNEKANYKACFQCHKPHEKIDFVISYPALAGRTVVASAAPMAAAASAVKIAGFAFGPNKVAVAPGKPVTWTNDDLSPHQITFTGANATLARSELLVKGQSHTQSFTAAGNYEYICGLHPQMKGAIEVK
jgi:plastocyanin